MPGFRSKSQNAIPVWQADDDGNALGTSANPVAVSSGGSGGTADQVQGNVASGATDAGNPVKIGVVYSTATTLATLTAGQRSDAQSDVYGSLRVAVTGRGQGFQDNATGYYYASAQNSNDVAGTPRPYAVGMFYSNGTVSYYARGDSVGQYVVQAPATAAATSLTPTVGSAVTSLVLKASAGNFFGGSIVAGATAGFLIAYNATSAPAGGAPLTAALILGVVPVAANGPAALGDYAIPDRFSTGIVLLFSTSTTTYTVPGNAALFMRGRAA